MSNNLVILLVIAGAYVLLGIMALAPTFRAGDAVRRAQRFADSLFLAIPEELAPATGRRLARRRRAEIIGGVLSLVVVLPFLYREATSDGPFEAASGVLMVGAVFVGQAIGTAIGSWQWPPPRDPDALRYARAGAVGLRDYIAPLERYGAWILIGVTALLAVATAALSAAGILTDATLPPTGFGGIIAGLALVALCFFEIVARRIVHRAQPSGSTIELAWDDAVRSSDVRGLASAPLVLGIYGVITLGFDLAPALDDLAGATALLILANVGFWLFLAAVAAVLIYAIASRPARHFLRRLWPELESQAPPPAVVPTGDKG